MRDAFTMNEFSFCVGMWKEWNFKKEGKAFYDDVRDQRTNNGACWKTGTFVLSNQTMCSFSSVQFVSLLKLYVIFLILQIGHKGHTCMQSRKRVWLSWLCIISCMSYACCDRYFWQFSLLRACPSPGLVIFTFFRWYAIFFFLNIVQSAPVIFFFKIAFKVSKICASIMS